ncbi:pentatricopeptide repeat-containing protein At1g62930, chloroplastic-like [Camellia sinensis]|uniref:pentatricopeptide repeat-containing protein At1g62930, chloroplastic-like n=1 Tax=Camellia sinensis TaxID=4442 RepID=UPI00103568A5|nr:pentatricopeptide repeat-containing protein At1g62930, chloroplastic-like [Camellia sinensis]
MDRRSVYVVAFYLHRRRRRWRSISGHTSCGVRFTGFSSTTGHSTSGYSITSYSGRQHCLRYSLEFSTHTTTHQTAGYLTPLDSTVESTPTSSSGRASSQNLEVDYGRVYTVVIVNCTFPSSVCHGGSGRQLLLHASTNGGGDRNSNVAATIEALSDSPWKLKPISLAYRRNQDKKLDTTRAFFHNLSSKGLQPNVKSYTMMIKGLCEKGLLHEAKELFLKMEQNGCLADDVAYNTIIQGFVRRHKCYEALILVEDMVQRDFSTDASIFPLIIDILSTKGQDPALQEVIKKFMPKDSRGMQENE